MLDRIIDSISERFIGKRDTIEKVVAVLLAGGHLLIEPCRLPFLWVYKNTVYA